MLQPYFHRHTVIRDHDTYDLANGPRNRVRRNCQGYDTRSQRRIWPELTRETPTPDTAAMRAALPRLSEVPRD